jgi:integrase
MEDVIMARATNKLAANVTRTARKAGKYSDGGGLELVVVTAERRSWRFRYMVKGKAREMSLGSADAVTLAQARDKAADARRLLAQGIDPLDQRQTERAGDEPVHVVTFAEAASQFIAGNEAGWRNPKHRQQWRSTIATYAAPIIGALPVGDVTTSHVMAVLEPIWLVKPETASRLRGRIEVVLNYSRVRGWRDGPNPAMWRGWLQMSLPARRKVKAVEHHAALPWQAMPAFMKELRQREGAGARCLEFAILAAARSGESRGALWSEIDLSNALWTLPAARMKGGRVHRVPLPEPALTVLKAAAEVRDGDAGYVFPGQRDKRPLSDMSLLAVLKRMGHGHLTAHGFRSSFRDWCAENGHAGDIAEAALAHAIGDKTEAAYRRGDMLARRRILMSDWAAFCGSAPADTFVAPSVY